MPAQRLFQELGRSLLEFAYPPSCPACDQGMEEVGEGLCPSCWQEILVSLPIRCPQCSCPLPTAEGSCANCADWDQAFERAVVLGRFGGAMQQAIHALKYRHYRKLGQTLGQRMGETLGSELREVDLLVPVPLHPARQRERGYNQSWWIARGLGKSLGIKVENGLVIRQLQTRQQAQLDARQRQENLRNAFRCVRSLPDHQCLGLVDDVLTTGATLDACARVLLEAGARRVWALALASPFREFLT